MKSSIYNISVPIDEKWVLVYNSASKGYLCLTTDIWNRCFDCDSNVKLTNLKDTELDLLKQNGFIVNNTIDEYAEALSLKMKSRLNKRVYSVIINPTLDCNLRCWYCYESHKVGSTISKGQICAIQKHIELKYLEDKFECLELSFFGGEPLLRANIVEEIINNVSVFCTLKGVRLRVSFTTNGTILPSKILSLLKDKDVAFQITLDGVKNQHNSIRGFKNKPNTNSYDIIWKNIKKLSDNIEDIQLCLRINYDNNTFVEHKELVDQILSIDNKNLIVSIQKVWQVDSNTINYEHVFDFVNTLLCHNVNVSFLDLSNGGTTCYADRINSIVINYDGKVFKCTARDFNDSNSIGKLLPSGDVIWDFDRLKQYSFAQVPSKCKECKLFPACTGICSQKIVETGDYSPCIINAPFTIEDYVLFGYKLKAQRKA